MAIVVPIVSEWNPKGLDRSLADIQKAEGAWGKAGAAVKAAAVPAGIALGALTVAAVDFTKAAIDDQAAAAKLAQGLRQSVKATDAQIASTEEWISAQTKSSGIADDEIRPSLERLSRSFGNLEDAQKNTSLAMEIAAQTGKPLETVANALAKANDGQMTSLKKLGITLGPVAQNMAELNKANASLAKAQEAASRALESSGPKSKEYAAALAKVAKAQDIVNSLSAAGTDWLGELGQQFGGSLAANAETTAGKMARFGNSMNELKETLGYALLPAFEALVPILQTVGSWAEQNTGVLLAIGGAIAGISVAVLAINAAMKIWQAASVVVTAAQWALNAALTANPIGLVVVAIAALIAALVLAYKKVDWFRKFVDAAWDGIYKAIEFVVTWFKETAWPILETVFGWIVDYVKAVATAYKTAWDLIYLAIETVWIWLRDTFGPAVSILFTGLKTLIDTLGTAFTTAFGLVKTAVSTAWDFIRPIVEKIADGIRSVIDGVKNLPGVSAILGDAQRAVSRTASVGVAGVGRSGGVVNISVKAGIGDPIEIGRQIDAVMRARRIRLGVA